MFQGLLLALVLPLSVTLASASVLYVDLNSVSPVPPYSDWSTAATNIQDAVDVASTNDVVLVTNGLYQAGGRAVNGLLTNRLSVTKAVTVQSVNGPGATTISGFGGSPSLQTTNEISKVRCAYLASGALLSGFTLTNGAALNVRGSPDGNGGGVWCESASAVVSNCVLTGNTAVYSGGGACQGTLINCWLTNNYSFLAGAGASQSILQGCVLIDNEAGGNGGGAANCTLNNCTVVRNSTFRLSGVEGAHFPAPWLTAYYIQIPCSALYRSQPRTLTDA